MLRILNIFNTWIQCYHKYSNTLKTVGAFYKYNDKVINWGNKKTCDTSDFKKNNKIILTKAVWQ